MTIKKIVVGAGALVLAASLSGCFSTSMPVEQNEETGGTSEETTTTAPTPSEDPKDVGEGNVQPGTDDGNYPVQWEERGIPEPAGWNAIEGDWNEEYEQMNVLGDRMTPEIQENFVKRLEMEGWAKGSSDLEYSKAFGEEILTLTIDNPEESDMTRINVVIYRVIAQ